MKDRDLGILITDHNVRETLKLTDRSAIIHEGRILREGTSHELVSDPRVREVYLGHGFDVAVGDSTPVSTAEERELFGPDSKSGR